MSLAGFQEAWASLLGDTEVREIWIASRSCPDTDMTPIEKNAIQALEPQHIQTMAGISGYGRQQMFEKVLPVTIRHLLGAERSYHLTYQYSMLFPSQKLYPVSASLPHLLTWLTDIVVKQGEVSEHWNDVVAYESTGSRLCFYGCPVPYIQRGCQLSPRAGLVSAGPDFQALLKALQKDEQIATFSTTPRTGYLLFKDSNGIQLEPLHWAVYLALSACDGRLSWEDTLVRLVRHYPELRSQASQLLNWENYFVKKGILFTPTT